MFTLDPDQIAEFRMERAHAFVAFWRQFYNYRVTVLDESALIDYHAELNVGRELTDENVRRLLRWKDPHQLTHRIISGPNAGHDNPRVLKVLRHLDALNGFRRGGVSEDEIRRTVAGIFPNGIVFQVFLVHIAAPHVYPIADQHVFRACSLHTRQAIQHTWDGYLFYRRYFNGIAEATGVQCAPASLPDLKKIDAALMAFGQFLKSYNYYHKQAMSR
jgi:hypothetical protein